MRINEIISKFKNKEDNFWEKWNLENLTFSNINKILVVSDTHANYDVLNYVIDLEKPDLILHAGDHEFSSDYLKENKIIFVQGNNDWFGPKELILNVNNLKIGLIHGHKQYNPFHWHAKLDNHFQNENLDLIIYGHSHKECFDQTMKPWILNPGSIAIPRNKSLTRTYATIEFVNNNQTLIKIKTTS